MDWSQALPDEVDVGFDHFSGLQSAAQAVLCSLIQAADINQTWMGDGARNLSEWVSVRLRTRIETARFLVAVARRLVDLPVLSERFSSGILSLDQVDAISRMATPDTEAGLIDDAVGLSNAALDRAARKAHPPSTGHERTGWERRALWLQWNLDQSELKLGGRLPAVGSRPHRSGKSDPVMRVPPSLRPRTPMAHHRATPRPSHPPTPDWTPHPKPREQLEPRLAALVPRPQAGRQP